MGLIFSGSLCSKKYPRRTIPLKALQSSNQEAVPEIFQPIHGMDETLQPILSGCRRGDALAQRHLFDRFKNPLFAVCLRYARDRPEAQDMLQDAFLVIFRDLCQYRGDGPLDAWLRRVTVRSALQSLRRKNPLRFAEDFDALPHDSGEPYLPDEEMNSDAILRMVQQLPPGYRTVFNLRCMEAFSYPEIAAELRITESSVRSQYTRACKHLRDMVERMLLQV